MIVTLVGDYQLNGNFADSQATLPAATTCISHNFLLIINFSLDSPPPTWDSVNFHSKKFCSLINDRTRYLASHQPHNTFKLKALLHLRQVSIFQSLLLSLSISNSTLHLHL